jgi:hypothetical protein
VVSVILGQLTVVGVHRIEGDGSDFAIVHYYLKYFPNDLGKRFQAADFPDLPLGRINLENPFITFEKRVNYRYWADKWWIEYPMRGRVRCPGCTD